MQNEKIHTRTYVYRMQRDTKLFLLYFCKQLERGCVCIDYIYSGRREYRFKRLVIKN